MNGRRSTGPDPCQIPYEKVNFPIGRQNSICRTDDDISIVDIETNDALLAGIRAAPNLPSLLKQAHNWSESHSA